MPNLVTVLSPSMPNITIDLIKKKIDGIRGQYRRELSNMTSSQKSGAGTKDVYKPKFWFFNNLEFLREGDALVVSRSTLTESLHLVEQVTQFIML